MTEKETIKSRMNMNYLYFAGIILLNLIFLRAIRDIEPYIYFIVNTGQFITLHIILEFFSILLAFMIFTITYYTYSKNQRFRLLLFSSTFLITGILDFVHTMSYEGMPYFFTESSVEKATCFWVISRVILAIGLLSASIIPVDMKSKFKRVHFLIGSIVITFAVSYFGIYHLDKIPAMYIEGVGLTKLKVFLEYFIMGVLAITSLFFIRDYSVKKDRVFLVFAMGLWFGVFTEAAFTLYRSVYDTYNLLGHLYKIISCFLIFRAVFVYNLDKPYIQLNIANQKIKQYAEDLEQVVENRTSEIKMVNSKMIEDLEYAKKIQQSFLPPTPFVIYGVKFISEYIPCERLSGDFLNIHVLDEENIGMYIADVSGHGVSAAMMTVFSDLAMKSTESGNRAKSLSPAKRLSLFYKEFNKSAFPNEMHIVMFKAVYNTKTKVLSYCSGGMNVLPILHRKSGEFEILDKSIGFPICKFGEIYTPEYENAYLSLERGDRIIFFTDGLLEHFEEESLDISETLVNILKENINESYFILNQQLLNVIKKNSHSLNNEDDITYFIMEA